LYAPLMGEDEARAANAFAVLMSQAVTLATDARRAGNPEAPVPAPLIAIDQAEEMLAAEQAEVERGRRAFPLVPLDRTQQRHAVRVPVPQGTVVSQIQATTNVETDPSQEPHYRGRCSGVPLLRASLGRSGR
jgi:hypothetical protein